MGKRAVGMPRERHKTLLRALGRLQRNRHMAEPSPRGYLRGCAAPSAPLRCPPSRGEHPDTPRFNFSHTAEQHVRKHAEVFSRGFLDFKGGKRQGEREPPTFIPVRHALSAPPSRADGLVPLQEGRAAVLLSALHDREPAPPVPTEPAAPQGVFFSLQLTVLSLSSVEAPLIQQHQPQPRTRDLPSCVLGPRPATVSLHLYR